MVSIARTRRIGERHGVDGMTVGWNTLGRKRDPRVGRRLKVAEIIDISASGAQLLVPYEADLVIGQLVTICAEDAVGTVRIARISPMQQRKLSVVGISFLHLDEALEKWLLSGIVGIAEEPVEVVWSR